jgi:hypothetical protein
VLVSGQSSILVFAGIWALLDYIWTTAHAGCPRTGSDKIRPMAEPDALTPTRELAYYYPDPMWRSGDWIKNLVLFFDGIAILLPRYLREKPARVDPAITAGLEEHGLLEIVEPEVAVDRAATEELGRALDAVLASGALDKLKDDHDSAFAALSMSRLGFYGDESIAKQIFGALKDRKLARETEDGVSLPMHRQVRSLVLVLLSQILQPYGDKIGATLCPATDVPELVHALGELLSVQPQASPGSVIEFDIAAVSVNLGPVPLDEVLGFRRENLAAHKLYSVSVRKFANELSHMDARERDDAFAVRQAELDDMASDLRNRSRKAWRKPASFGLGLAGAAVSLAHGNPVGAALSVGAGIVGYQSANPKPTGAYSYLFNAQRRFGY